MSVLTKTALVLFSMYLLMSLSIAPFAPLSGRPFLEYIGDLIPEVVLPLLVAVITELMHRIVKRSRNSWLSMPVPWLQVIATVYLMNLVMASVNDKESSVLAMTLVALASLAALLFRGKFLRLPSFWLLNACAVIVIGVCWTGSFLVNEGMPTFEEALSGLPLVFSCVMIVISCYVNYIRIK